jgi:gamma-glutamylcyclotransferase (GGCT)/AIG2-like uncharacterized protein YtfP
VAPEPKVVFVYGTLLPGEQRWPILSTFVVDGEHRDAVVRGRLYDTGLGYPAAVFDGDADGAVPGLLVTLAEGHVERALEILDRVEGTDYELYARTLVTTVDGEHAWAYAWQGDCDGLTPIDRWISRD